MKQTFKQLKIVKSTNWPLGTRFKVCEIEYLSSKPIVEIGREKLFKGSILECESYIKLKEKDIIAEKIHKTCS